MQKLRVGIIFGGRSGEHDVSLRSARSVMQALDREKYEIVPIGITRTGEWKVAQSKLLATSNGSVPLLEADAHDARAATLLSGAETSALLQIDSEAKLTEFATLDVVFPVLHGTYGEDGTVQGLLELANVPYVGGGVVGSAVGMDKAIFKYVMESQGLPVLPWKLVLRSRWQEDENAVLSLLESTLNYPMFTKPANLGSSVGIAKCADRAALKAGIADAARFDRRIVVEQGVQTVRELEVAVLGNDRPTASVVGEIRPKRAFYDYKAKYITDDSALLIPAPISAEMSDKIRQLAIAAYTAIDGAGLGRADFLLDAESGQLYINEINTLPGFTDISMYPKLWEATGLTYSGLLDKLIELALERFDEKVANVTTFEG
ncbi:MAG TPA: D-alanine--D-alanine ligase [Anaerolineae bacterium]|nr:D-alanine--D-alanine ligase [Anaerolineae bacterium]